AILICPVHIGSGRHENRLVRTPALSHLEVNVTTLTHAHRELFRRRDDERFPTFTALAEHCRTQKQQSLDRWQPPQTLRPLAHDGELLLAAGDGGEFHLNDWSFTQLCSLARVSRDTVNRVFPETAARILTETMPSGNKP